MKIAGPVPPPFDILRPPARDIGARGFDDILGQAADQDSSGLSRAISAGAIAPEIGDSAVRFEDKPMVLLSAVELGSPSDIFQPDSDFAAYILARMNAAAALGQTNPGPAAMELTMPRTGGEGQPGLHVSAAAMQALIDAARASAPGPQPIGIPLAAQSPPQGIATPPAPGSLNAAGSGPSHPAVEPEALASSAARWGERSGARSAVSAHLFAASGGLRLVLKMPSMSADEHMELTRKLAGLFGEYGRPAPELLIYHPEAPERG